MTFRQAMITAFKNVHLEDPRGKARCVEAGVRQGCPIYRLWLQEAFFVAAGGGF